jgi:BirA family biotin operon repressor/biotin-[acetyl-CoA-carboxylase] ligase
MSTRWRLEIYGELPSTSDLCIARADAGEAEGLAVLARRQTSGRGRSGRVWQAPDGNLNLSVLLRPTERDARPGPWSLIAALALHDALRPHAGGALLTLKWPNDVLLAGGKLAGILIDSALGADGRLAWLVLGMGANLAAAPDLADRPTACLPAPAPTPETVAAAVLDGLTRWRSLHLARGFAAVREAWLARAHPVGTPLSVRAGASLLAGHFAGLAEDGSILLRIGETIRTIPAGEVQTRPAGQQEAGEG